MSSLDKTLRAYLLSYLILLVIALVPMIFNTQDELFLYLNQFHSSFFDKFFTWLTFYGDGLTFALLVIVLAIISYRKAILGLLIFLSTAAIAQVLKRLVFDEWLRPFGRLGQDHDLYIPENIDPLVYNSFPSGHATTAFALAAFLTLIIKKKAWWPLFLVLAILAGYSRVYLTHHYPIDVWTGSIIGTLGAFFIYWWLDPKLRHKFGDKGLWRR